MARMNVYLPDRLAAEVRASGLNLSHLAQLAAERELARWRVESWLARVVVESSPVVSHEEALAALRAGSP